MDPLSVTASVVGLIAFAAKISSLLFETGEKFRAAPKEELRHLQVELDSFHGILQQLETSYQNTSQTVPRSDQISLPNALQRVLEDTTWTLQEMEILIRRCNASKWIWKAKDNLERLKLQLQAQKGTVCLMLLLSME
jgi:hypothetical protein